MLSAVTSQEFDRFVQEKKDQYPFYELRMTRGQVYADYVMCMKPRERYDTHEEYIPLQATCFSSVTLQYLIIQQEVMPMPKDMCEVMEYMAKFGKGMDRGWMEATVHYFGELLFEQQREPQVYTRKNILGSIIQRRVTTMLERPIEGYKASKQGILYSWKKWFDGEFYSDYQNFHTLATGSFNFVVKEAREEKMAKEHNSIML